MLKIINESSIPKPPLSSAVRELIYHHVFIHDLLKNRNVTLSIRDHRYKDSATVSTRTTKRLIYVNVYRLSTEKLNKNHESINFIWNIFHEIVEASTKWHHHTIATRLGREYGLIINNRSSDRTDTYVSKWIKEIATHFSSTLSGTVKGQKDIFTYLTK